MFLPALVLSIALGPTPGTPEGEAEIQVSDPKVETKPAPVRERGTKLEPKVGVEHVSSMTDKRVGGVLAPAVLPAGAMAVYAMLGAPELGGGFRQGFGIMELEVRLLFNYLLASGALEIGLKFPVYEKDKIQMAPIVALGLEANSGSRYYDRGNFAFVAIRPRVGFVTSYRFSDTVAGLVLFDLPWSVPFTSQGTHVVPTLGAGAEAHLGGNMSGFFMANVGLDAIKEPLGVTQYRTAWAVKLGIGFRLF